MSVDLDVLRIRLRFATMMRDLDLPLREAMGRTSGSPGPSRGNALLAAAQPHCPTAPQAVQSAQPSRWITVGLPHSAQSLPASSGLRSAGSPSRTPMSRGGQPCSSSTPSIAPNDDRGRCAMPA